MANSQEVYLGGSNSDLQLELAAESGNACISETKKRYSKIPATNLGYKTMYRWKIVLESKYNNRQPEYRYGPQNRK